MAFGQRVMEIRSRAGYLDRHSPLWAPLRSDCSIGSEGALGELDFIHSLGKDVVRNMGLQGRFNRKRGTRTSKFGTSKRESHDSSTFYRGRLYRDLMVDERSAEVENPVPAEILNRFLCQDSAVMERIPDSCVHLMVTSPPYNVGKEYDKDLSMDDYIGMLRSVFSETYRVLVNGGRVCVNVANVGRRPYIPYHKFVMDAMIEVGFLMRGEIIWTKGAGAGVSTAWGSWCSASNPTLRDTHEYILVFSKGKFSRNSGDKVDTISREEFLEYTKSVWTFAPESAKRMGHPAPFPVELPRRCILLYTFRDEIVLDPFCGVGTTALAAAQLGRYFICLDNNPDYLEKARARVSEYSKEKADATSSSG